MHLYKPRISPCPARVCPWNPLAWLSPLGLAFFLPSCHTLMPRSTMKYLISRTILMHPCWDLHFSHENVQLPFENFYARIFFLVRIKFSLEIPPRFCFPPGFSPGSRRWLFSWGDSSEDRFLGGILAKMQCGNFSWGGSHRENWPPWQDLSTILGRIMPGSGYPFYKGYSVWWNAFWWIS